MIPKPKLTESTKSKAPIEDAYENFQEVDEGQRPHVSICNTNTRDTPIKRGALAFKNHPDQKKSNPSHSSRQSKPDSQRNSNQPTEQSRSE